jgi:hypothetical protein
MERFLLAIDGSPEEEWAYMRRLPGRDRMLLRSSLFECFVVAYIVLPFCAIASHKHKNTNEALIEKEDGGGMMGRLACLDVTLYSRGTIFYWSCRLKSTKRSLMLTTVQGLNGTLYISVD